jgi:hypothetical protein
VAAAIFGEDGHVEFVGAKAFDRFEKLNNEECDMLSRTTTHTMERATLEVRIRKKRICMAMNPSTTHIIVCSRVRDLPLILRFPTCTMVCNLQDYSPLWSVPTT